MTVICEVIDGFVVIGEHRIRPTDTGLIESLRQRGYTVSFQDVPESGRRGRVPVDPSLDPPGTDA